MHKRIVNQCLIDLEIRTEGPLLIKTGAPVLEGPDMSPVVTLRSRPKPEPYIPGSSLKGVLRSHAERIARTLCWEPETWHVGACNPFLTEKQRPEWLQQGAQHGYCGSKFQIRKDRAKEARQRGEPAAEISSPVVYHDSCPACKIFGSTFLIGRFAIPDAYLLPGSTYQIERRDGVGIDRFTGGSSKHAKFDLEVVTNAKFHVQLQLVNFELWQLGLIAYVLRDLCEGAVGIGSGKSRGLGQVSATIPQLQVIMVTQCLPQRDVARLWGTGALESTEARRAYGYWENELQGVLLKETQPLNDPLRLRTGYRLEGQRSVTALWSLVAPLATQRLEEYEVPEKMRLPGTDEGRR